MRFDVILLFLFFSANAVAQEVTIQGFAVDSTKGRNRIHIVVNDTLKRWERSWDSLVYPEGTGDKISMKYSYTTKYKSDGFFSIKAQLSDTLYFMSSVGIQFISQKHAVQDLLKLDEVRIELEPNTCVEYVRCEEEITNFYAFVGEVLKVKVEEHPYYCDFLPMDSKYRAELKIIDQIHGLYPEDTISFIAYDHYGKPNFSEYTNVLIYVVENCEELYHIKYQYSPVYKVNGKWQVPYFTPRFKRDSLLIEKAKPLKFVDSVQFPLGYFYDEEKLKNDYPERYFSREGDYILPKYGYDLEDVFENLRGTLFKSYGYFKE